MEPKEMFNWYQARNRLKLGICRKVTHTLAGNYRTRWYIKDGILYCASHCNGRYSTRISKNGPAEDRKNKQMFHEV